MGRTPRSPQSYKQDTMGVGFELNCPDRSWCVAQVGQHKTKRRHRSGKQANSRRAKWTQEQKDKRPEALKERITGRSRGRKAGSRWIGNPTASARDFAPLRCAPRGQRCLKGKTWRTNPDPLDNPHRRCSAWFAIILNKSVNAEIEPGCVLACSL